VQTKRPKEVFNLSWHTQIHRENTISWTNELCWLQDKTFH